MPNIKKGAVLHKKVEVLIIIVNWWILKRGGPLWWVISGRSFYVYLLQYFLKTATKFYRVKLCWLKWCYIVGQEVRIHVTEKLFSCTSYIVQVKNPLC